MMSSFDCPSIWWWPLTVRLVTWSESRAIIGTDSPKVGIGDQIKPDSSHPSKSKTPSTGFPSRDMTQPIITPHFLKRPSSKGLHYRVWATLCTIAITTTTTTHRVDSKIHSPFAVHSFAVHLSIYSQSQFSIHSFARISTYFGKPKLSPSRHILVYRNMTYKC